MPRLAQRNIGIIFLLINTVVWGAALPIVKPALDVTTPFQFLLYRYLFAAILSLPILGWFLWKKRNLLKSVPTIIGIELLGTVAALGFLYEGLDRTTSLEASIIANTLPFFVVLGGIFFLREKEERREWLGLLIALAGTTYLTIEPLLDGRLFSGEISFTGNLLVVGHNVAQAAAFLLAKRHYQKLPKFFVTSISFYIGIVSFAVLAMVKNNFSLAELFTLTVQELQISSVFFASAYMALFGSIIGLTAYIIGQSKMEASEASLFWYLQPIVYVPLAVSFLREPVTPGTLIALVTIVAGVVLAEVKFRPARKKR